MRKLSRWVLCLCLLAASLSFAAALADGGAPVMTVNDETDGIVLAFNEAPVIRVNVPEGATALDVEAERISNPDGTPLDPESEKQEWNEWYDINRIRPMVEITERKFFDAGIWQITARYTTDDYGEEDDPRESGQWVTLASLNVSVSEYVARMDAPSVTLAAASVAQSDWLRVTLGNFQQKNEWYWYELAQMDENTGSWGEWFDHVDLTLKEGISSTFSVPTLDLEPGTYRLRVRTEAVGYEDNESFKTFIVTASSALQDGITLSAASVPAGVPVEISLRAAGADWMQVEATQDEDPFWDFDPYQTDGDEGVWRMDFDRPGTYRMTLKAYEGENSRTVGATVLTVTASDALAPIGFSGFPGFLTSGQGLDGTIVLDDRTERTYIELCYCPEDGGWETLYNVFRTASGQEAETVSLPASLFAWDGRYRLHAHAYAAGLESSYKDYWLIRSAAGTGGVTLKVNGGTQAVTVPSSSDVYVEIIAPTATAARVLYGDRWEYRGDPDEFSFIMGFDSGDYALVAQIATESFDRDNFHWEDLNWGAYSNAVPVHVESVNGPLDLPAVTLSADTVARGEWLHATIAGQNRGERYWAEVRKLWRDDHGSTHWDRILECHGDEAEGFAIPCIALEPDSYYLTVGAYAVGWENREISLPFTVTDSAAPLPDIFLSFPRDTTLTSQDIAFCACAEDADRVTVDVSWDEDPNWNNHYEDNREVNTWNFGCSQSGTYVFTLRAWQDGEVVGEDSFTLTVSAPYGQLEDLAVDNIPVTMTVGDGLLGSFTADQNATDYGVQLTYCPEGEPWDRFYDRWRDANQQGAAELSFPAECFTRPGVYRLEVHTTALGYNGAHLNKQILVTEAGMQQSLTLSVDADEIYLHQNIPVSVAAPSNVTAVRLWSSSYDRWDYQVNEGEGFRWEWGFHNGGEETLLAQGTTDPSVPAWLEDHDGMWDFDWSQVSWTMNSAPVTVNVIKYGDLDAPEVTFPQGTTVERGQMLQMTIAPVAHAYSYGVQVRSAEGNNNGRWPVEMDYTVVPETTLISLPTDCLEPGEYTVLVDPRCYGWHGDSREYPFTVTQSASWTGDAVFRVSNTELLTREYVTCSVYAPGAEEVMWRIGDDGENWRQNWGESLSENIVFYGKFNYVMRGFARYPDEDEWTQIGDDITVNVSAPYGTMDVTLQVPAAVQVSEPLTITAACDFKGKTGSVNCYIESPTERSMLLDAVDEYDEDGLHYITYRVDADTLAMGPWFVTAYAIPGAKGYDVGYDEKKVDVTAGTLEAELSVNPNPAEIFDDVHIHFEVPGATAVALYNTLNGMDWLYEPDDSVDDDQTIWWDGEYTLYGLYTTEEIDPSEDGFAWENVHWEGASGSVTLVVNPPTAELEELNVTLDKSTVKRGERLKVTILNNNPGLEVSYGANLQPTGTDGYSSDYAWFGPEEDDAKTIWIETLEVEPGEYRVMVSANARGCHPVNTWIPVTVTAADDGLQMTVRDRNVLTGNMLPLVGYANGATHLRLDISFANGTWEPDPAMEEIDGDCLRTEVFAGEHPDTLELTLTAAYADGSTEVLNKHITVTAPNGKVKPVIRLNSAWGAGKDLDFTVSVGQRIQYVAFVQEPDAEEAIFAEFVPPGTPEKQFHLSKDEFEAGKAYEILVIAAGTGYDGGRTYLPLTQRASLTTLRLPAGLRTIGEEAFAGVAAEKIVVPDGVTVIESNAFSACPNLMELVLPEGITTFATDALGTSGPVYVYGQAGSYLETYAAAIAHLIFVPIE